jgi:signal transduction histidine kinase
VISSGDILKASILIVDDQEANVSLLEQMLGGAGYVSVTSTKDSHAVFELHRQNHYSLILLDLQMPGLDGFQVMEGLKSIETDGYIPVLVVTVQPEHKLRALKAGAKDFVSKPFDLAEVLARVHNLIEVRLLHQQAESRTKQAEAQFIEVQKKEAIGRLAGGVAHDFNNILGVIMGYSDLMKQELGSDNPLSKHLSEIQDAAQRAAWLTRQLLIFSRKQTVQLVVLDLNDAVKELDKMLRRLIEENIKMTVIHGKQIGRVKAHSGYIDQVLVNLVVNSRDAMPDGGTLTIATRNVTLDADCTHTLPGAIPGDYVMLSVSDSGTGMSGEVKAHLFEAFFTTKPEGKGTGLGLATCQTIIQQSGGHIGVYSEPGKGTTIEVYFPRVELPLDVARLLPAGPLARGTETVLVVEDDSSVRHLVREVLETQGYEVLSSAHGQDALQMVRKHGGSPLRLVVTDMIMPLMGGKAMVEWLKTTYPDLKILFVSGYTDDANTHHGVLETGVEFLSKPFTPAALARKVRELLDVK